MLNQTELRRQIAHFSGIGFAGAALLLTGLPFKPGLIVGFVALSSAIFFLFFSEYVFQKHRIRKSLPFRVRALEALEDQVHSWIGLFERRNARPYSGAVNFFLGIGLAYLLFPLEIAIISNIVLAVGDSVSTLAGVHFGKHKIPYTRGKKSWVGTLSGFAFSVLFLLPLTDLQTALFASAVGMFIEAVPALDDNLFIPLGVGAALLGLRII